MQNFVFIITAYNVRPFLGALVASLALQRHPAWKAIFIDDASTDGTSQWLNYLLNAHALTERFHVIVNQTRQGRAPNVFTAIAGHIGPDDVIAMLDGDDHLASDDALTILSREYDRGWEIVWSNWRGTDGCPGTCTHLHPFISPRRQPFVSGHLFTFKRRLFDAITQHDFQDDVGVWLPAATDVALALPLLDQTIKRKHLEQTLLIYNRQNPLSHALADPARKPKDAPRLGTRFQNRICRMLMRRPPKPLAVDQQFLHSHLYELLQFAATSTEVLTSRRLAKLQQMTVSSSPTSRSSVNKTHPAGKVP